MESTLASWTTLSLTTALSFSSGLASRLKVVAIAGNMLSSVAFFFVLSAAGPVLAEAPVEPSELNRLRQANVQQLLIRNECMGCDLAGISLRESHLIGADLRGANLQGADLSGANLEGADLEGALLTGANLSQTFLTDANLANAKLQDVNFSGAWLYNVDVTGADVQNLNLAGAQLMNTPISVGGDDYPLQEGVPLEPMIPFDQTEPPVFQ
jgi:uncharacterized protein YjbI with pentapeptide repeats